MYESISQVYDYLNQNKNYNCEINLILKKYKQINGNNPNHILDIGCGTGNHLKSLSPHIVSGIGIDISEKMILEAKRKNLSNIQFKTCAVDEITNTFELITLLFQVINHIYSLDELEKLIRGISKKSKSGTVLIFDIFNIVAMILDNPKKEQRIIKDMKVIIDPFFDALNSSLILNYTVHYKNTITKYTLRQTLWNIHTIKSILLKYDFNIIEILGNWIDKSATQNSYKLLFICKKK